MTQREFRESLTLLAPTIEEIKQEAHALHAAVNQTYDHVHPYALHLDMVAAGVYKYGHYVCIGNQDVVPLLFGAYFHDSIEDARQTYNDIVKTARRFMNEEQAILAAEIVYALTNDKGRTRAERAGEKYYQGIRQTPYAPFTKMADRLANTAYSFTHTKASITNSETSNTNSEDSKTKNETISTNTETSSTNSDSSNTRSYVSNSHMLDVYRAEWPHFLESIKSPHDNDIRYSIPTAMVEEMEAFFA